MAGRRLFNAQSQIKTLGNSAKHGKRRGRYFGANAVTGEDKKVHWIVSSMKDGHFLSFPPK
jgi:hypothetical protein